jgi:hypothetical protein
VTRITLGPPIVLFRLLAEPGLAGNREGGNARIRDRWRSFINNSPGQPGFPESPPMNETYNGMPVPELPGTLAWRKSSRSNPSGNCVEVAELPGGEEIAVRNSRDPQGPALIYTLDEITAFVEGARDGDFDHLMRLNIHTGAFGWTVTPLR